MDISLFWRILKYVILPALVAWASFRAVRRLRHKRLRRAVKTGASAVAGFSALFLLLLMIAEVACTKYSPRLYSPDRKHVASLSYALQGALGDDYATVLVRTSWSPFATSAYNGLGSWDFKQDKPSSPEVRWLGDSRLLIRYYDDRTGKEGRSNPANCRSQVGNIQVVCEKLSSKSGIIP